MRNKFIQILLVISLLAIMFLSPALARAQGGLTVESTSVQAQFPTQLQFNLTASSNVNINDVRIRYKVDRTSFADVVSEGYVQFTPNTRVNLSWTMDMLKIGGLPPGANVQYWWVVRDASGKVLETAPDSIQFNDSRYAWKTLSPGNVALHWYEGDDSFINDLMSAAQSALVRLSQDTGATLEKKVDMYIYASSQDLQGAMIFPQEWTGGVAYPGYSIVAIGIATNNVDWGRGAIAHELTHLVVHEVTANPYSDLPTWLDEGLATYGEGTGGAQYRNLLLVAEANHVFISVRSLSSPFSAVSSQAYLSYAESYSLVEYLISTYGQAKMLDLLNTFHQGATYDGALQKVYGFDRDGLYTRWQDYITQQLQPTKTAANHPASPVLAGAAW